MTTTTITLAVLAAILAPAVLWYALLTMVGDARERIDE